MGNRISISQPAVIHTELRPLDESFWIGANGQLEQWYNENDNVFAPDRTVTPLTLSPHLSVKDGDTGNGYSTESSPSTLTFQYVTWKVKEWDGTEYVETTITSTTNTDPYYKSGNNLVVQKNNYDPAHAITITCEVRYNDPRDVGAMNDTQGSTMLVTSVDATAVYPVIDIANPSARSFNPLKDDAIYEFTAVADFPTTARGASGAQCPCDALGTEEVVKGVNSVAPTMTIQYGEGIDSVTQENQTFVRRQTSGGAVSSIHGDVSFIKTIQGNAVAWNQLDDPSKESTTLGELTVTWVNDHYHISGTSTIDYQYWSFANIQGGLLLNKTVAGHKYYMGGIRNNSNPNIIIRPLVTQNADFNNPDVYTDNGSYIFVASDSIYSEYLYNLVESGETIDLDYYPICIDLTLMFGVGNEPSTVEAFESWLANNIGQSNYYPYNAGELLNSGRYSVMWNQHIQNGDFSDGLDYWIPWSTEQTTTVSDGVCYMELLPNVTQGAQQQNINYVAGHKYYIHSLIKGDAPTSNEPLFFYSDYVTERVYYTPSTSWQKISEIRDFENGILVITFFRTNLQLKDVYMIDLTLLFGAGNEPSTVDEFERWLVNNMGASDYYAYNSGEKISKYAFDIKTVGFNQWNEETRLGYWNAETGEHYDGATDEMSTKDLIPVFGDTKYFIRMPIEGSNVVVFYDANRNYISYTVYSFSSEITTPSNARFMGINFGSYGTTYNHDICINMSNSSKNGTYEPYKTFTRNLDVTKLYGKNSQGNYVQMFPNGMRSAGSVHDVVDLENATADVKVGTRFFNGTENWSLNETYTANHEFNLEIGDWAVLYLRDANAACNLYALGKNYDGSVLDNGGDRMWTVLYGLLFFNDSRFTTVQGWKDHLAALYAANTPLGYYFDLSQPIHYTDVVYRSGGADTPVSKLFGSFEWYGVNSSGQEVPIDTLPIYTNAPQPTNGGQHTESIRINALYGKEIPVILRVKRHPWDASVLPPKVTKSVAWKIPPIDVVVVSDKGSAVRFTHIPVGQTAEDFTFSTIVNQQGDVISDAKKADNMVFKWYYVKYATNGQAIIPTGETSPEVYVGSGQTQTISAATLKNTKPVGGESTSTSVFCEAYLLGAYHLVNGQWVRTIDE